MLRGNSVRILTGASPLCRVQFFVRGADWPRRDAGNSHPGLAQAVVER